MSNSSRIEAATRQHVGAILTAKMITELVQTTFPEYKGGTYPSDAVYVRTDGILVPRGKVAYGDGVLEWMAANSFKVLADNEIVRMPRKRAVKPAVAAAVETPVTPAVATPEQAQKTSARKQSKKKLKKAAKKTVAA